MISLVLSDEMRSTAPALSDSLSFADRNAAHSGKNYAGLFGIGVADERLRFRGQGGRLVHESQRHGARVVAIRWIATVYLEHHEVGLERPGEGANPDRALHFLHSVAAL